LPPSNIETATADLDAGHLIHDQAQPSLAADISQIWPVFVVGLAFLATMDWIACLGWLLYHAVLWLI